MGFESLQFSKSARMVAELGKIKPGDNVCLVTDTDMLSMAPAVAEACVAAGGETVICVMTPRRLPNNPPPLIIAAAMKQAHVAILLTSRSLGHTMAASEAQAAGARIVNLRQMTEDLFASDVLTPDYVKLYQETRKLADLMDAASEARVITRLGTDIRMSLEGRKALCNGGPLAGGSRMNLPCGEAAISPLEGTLEGTIMVDHAIDAVGLLSSPVKVVARQGKAVSIEGGKEAEELRHALSQADGNAYNFAELAIGTNPNSRLLGNVAEDKKKRGAVHVAIGDNHLLGGKVSSSTHLDMIMLKPNVWLDGRQVVKEGELEIQ